MRRKSTFKKMVRDASHYRGLWLIAAFKLLKGLALLALGIGALKLLHKDVAAEAEHWVNVLRVDPDNYYIQRLLQKFSILDDRRLKELSVGTFFYAALLLTEGVGLALAKAWGGCFQVIVTSSLVPVELYELAKQVTFAKVVVLLINIAVVVYLVIVVRRKKH